MAVEQRPNVWYLQGFGFNLKLICVKNYIVAPHVAPQMRGICSISGTAGNVWPRRGPTFCEAQRGPDTLYLDLTMLRRGGREKERVNGKKKC